MGAPFSVCQSVLPAPECCEVLCLQFCPLTAWSLWPQASCFSHFCHLLPSHLRLALLPCSGLALPKPMWTHMSFLPSLPNSGLAFLIQPALSLKGLAVSVDFPCSKTFHGSPLPTARQPMALIQVDSRLSLTFTRDIAPPAAHSSLAMGLLEAHLLLPV